MIKKHFRFYFPTLASLGKKAGARDSTHAHTHTRIQAHTKAVTKNEQTKASKLVCFKFFFTEKM